MISKIMKCLEIKYYDFNIPRKTLTIYEPVPVKVLSFIRSQINKDITINIKTN